jgi:hypothetical protein
MARLFAGLICAYLLTSGCASDPLQEEPPMRAELRIDGGVGFFPGLVRPITLDESDLSADERQEFSRLVSAARALPGAAPGAAVRAVPDGRTYRITIASGDGNIELRCTDAAVPPAFSTLMVFIKQHGHR